MDFRIGHLAYRTRDMEKTLAFYTGALGFQHIFSLANERGEKWIEYVMTPDGCFLEFFYPDETPVEPGTGYMHLCLEVDDCAAAVAELMLHECLRNYSMNYNLARAERLRKRDQAGKE